MIGGIVDGKFRVLRLLGEGGMGSVYEAERIMGVEDSVREVPSSGGRRALPGSRVALKVIMPELLSDGDSSSVGRFHREARAASAMDTEHIVQVLDFGTDPETDAPYMAMELLEGEDLEHALSRAGALRPDVALRIAAQVCMALDKAHRARVIHRDIKPANVFLAAGASGEVTVKVLDFGIAKIKAAPGGQTSGLTRTGGVLGSPRYMSPEQALGSRSIDFRTDLWSLGVVLYRALSGKHPHDEVKTMGGLILAICTTPPRPLEAVAPWVPPEVAAVVHKALKMDVNDRFESAGAMLEAIGRLLPSGFGLDRRMLGAPEGTDGIQSVSDPGGAEQSVDSVGEATMPSGEIPALELTATARIQDATSPIVGRPTPRR